MSHYLRGLLAALITVVFAASLAGCGSLSENIADDGASAEQIIWPDRDDTTPLHKGGSTPTIDDLRSLYSGMEKSQISRSIGYPHFSEGRWKVREWDYLFSFQTRNGLKICQFKVLFDEDYLAQSFHWRTEECHRLIWPRQTETFSLSADTLFAFDKAEIREQGRNELDELVEKIEQHEDAIDNIRIVGYTDIMGPEGYNRLLSQQRAFAVLTYLEEQGVPGRLMTAVGMGKSDPVKTDCDVNAEREKRIDCMAPNRRVEIQVESHQTRL